MYLRKFSQRAKFLSNNFGKKFSIGDFINRNSLAFRMTKYDPTKEIEVNKYD